MKKLITGLAILLGSTPLVAFAQAVCKINGEVVPCSEMPVWFGIMLAIVPIVGVFLAIFWFWMLIDAIKNQNENKLMWVLLILFLNVLGAIIYFFSQKRKRAKV